MQHIMALSLSISLYPDSYHLILVIIIVTVLQSCLITYLVFVNCYFQLCKKNETIIQLKSFFFLIQITWHPVSRDVGNVKNKSESLPLKVDIDSEPIKKLSKSEEKSKNLMAQWLSKGSSAKKSANDKNDDEKESPDEKRIKKE